MQKLIPKIDAEKELICAFMDPEMSYKGTKGGAPGGKEGKPPKAALRHLASLVWNAWHRPVSADCSSGRPPTPWDPGCWSDYFYTRNWRTLVETSVTGAKKGIQKRHAKFNAEKVVNINAKRLPKWGQNGCWCGRGVPIAWFWKPKPSKYHQNGFQNLWNIEVVARMRF